MFVELTSPPVDIHNAHLSQAAAVAAAAAGLVTPAMTLPTGLPAVSMAQFLPHQSFLPFHSLMANGQHLGMPTMASMASTSSTAAAVLDKV